MILITCKNIVKLWDIIGIIKLYNKYERKCHMDPKKYEDRLNEAKLMVVEGKSLKEVRDFLKSKDINASKAQVKQFMKYVKSL